jgi:hypothetical protein
MENYRIDAIGLLLALIAITLLLSEPQMGFGFLSSLSGLTILLVLSAFDRRYRSGVQSLAFAAVGGACCLLVDGYLLQLLAEPTKFDRVGFDKWLSIIWLVEAAIFWGVDRARMGSRQQAFPQPSAPVARTTGQGFIAQSVPVTGYVPPVPAPAPVPAYVPPPPPPPPQPVYRQPEPVAPAYVPPPPPPPPQPVYQQPEPVAPTYVPPPPPPQPVFHQPEPVAPAYVPPPPLIEPVYPPATAAPPAPPVAPPPVHQIPPGKEATIYVNLMGEAMNMLRAVRAESVGRDFYLIADEMPENETWEFKPGQIVRCKKKNLSSGKALVAFEEAPRA